MHDPPTRQLQGCRRSFTIFTLGSNGISRSACRSLTATFLKVQAQRSISKIQWCCKGSIRTGWRLRTTTTEIMSCRPQMGPWVTLLSNMPSSIVWSAYASPKQHDQESSEQDLSKHRRWPLLHESVNEKHPQDSTIRVSRGPKTRQQSPQQPFLIMLNSKEGIITD